MHQAFSACTQLAKCSIPSYPVNCLSGLFQLLIASNTAGTYQFIAILHHVCRNSRLLTAKHLDSNDVQKMEMKQAKILEAEQTGSAPEYKKPWRKRWINLVAAIVLLVSDDYLNNLIPPLAQIK
jgi:hypothetical protein